MDQKNEKKRRIRRVSGPLAWMLLLSLVIHLVFLLLTKKFIPLIPSKEPTKPTFVRITPVEQKKPRPTTPKKKELKVENKRILETPLEETMGALDYIVRSGRALYAGISSYNSRRTRQAVKILKELGTPCLIHQPSYNMMNRWVETDKLLDTLEELKVGSIAFTPLAQGLLTDRYLRKIPPNSRALQQKSLDKKIISADMIKNLNHLNDIAATRGQSLAQMAIAWVLRANRITTALIGASSSEQILDCIGAIKNLTFSEAELNEIDLYAKEESLNLWAKSAEL